MFTINSEIISIKAVAGTAMAVLVIAVFSSCKSSEVSTNQSAPATSGQSLDELSELYWARQDSARMNFTEADVNFMTDMIIHHAQALIMSRLAPENGASPAVQRLASRIINAQRDEINTMQNWLRDRNQPVPEIHIDGLNLMVHGLGGEHAGMDHSDMAGMLSPSQLQELSNAEGREFDRLFLEYMISHHEGAVLMVTRLFGGDSVPQDEAAFRMASDIQVDQRTEIDRMQLMLEEMTASD